MRTVLIFLMLAPALIFSQTKDSVVVYHGSASFENAIIDLSHRHLAKLPSISVEVETLILDDNNLTSLPNWLAELKNLKTLSIRNNKLLDVSILKYCTNLEQVYLCNNSNLDKLPNFNSCKRLKVLDVIGTKINELPLSIRGMDSIAYFKYTAKK